jgi:hypothetical protein
MHIPYFKKTSDIYSFIYNKKLVEKKAIKMIYRNIGIMLKS